MQVDYSLNNSDFDQFTPPYCPNPSCHFHQNDRGTRFYWKDGWERSNTPPYKNQRYVCRHCHKKFSYNTFQLNYRRRFDPKHFEYILYHSVKGLSNRSMASYLNISEGAVRSRISLLARQSILQMRLREKNLKIEEPVAYDGFETFQYSQHDPCYVNTAVGRDSHFHYELNYSPLNRKGRKTDEQKRIEQKLIERYGKYPTNAIQAQTLKILKRLKSRTKNKVELLISGKLAHFIKMKRG